MILIVEDDPLARRALQSLLVASGYPCRAVNSAEDALELLGHSDQSGIALIDIDLPGMNGFELLEQLKHLYPKLACTLMSANDHVFPSAEGDIPVPFLPKPLNIKRLRNFLGQASRAAQS